MMRALANLHSKAITLAAAVVLGGLAPASRAIDIQFDFTFDSNNFFVGNAQRQNTLNAAASIFEARLTDTLSAITPGGSNTWTASFDHPGTGATQTVVNRTIAQNVIVVYAGGRNFAGDTLGEGGPGGFSASGTGTFVNSVSLRGQTGAGANPPTDFGPWGGFISFDTATAWYFDQNVTTMENIGTMADFYSVAVHELAHLLGFGTSPSWDAKIDDQDPEFIGPVSMSLNGGAPVPLSNDLGHWAEGVESDVLFPVVINDQETAMDPTIFLGDRKYFTELDFAGLDDIGWDVIPEPGSIALLGLAATALATKRRRLAGVRGG